MAAILTAKYRISKRATKEVLIDFLGVQLGLGSVCRIERQASAALGQAVVEARENVRAAAVVNADETGWRENKLKAWLWVAVSATLAVFLIARGRGREVAQQLLGRNFSGYLGSDRWSAYQFVDLSRRQLCWAHLIRDFSGWSEYGGQAGKSGKQLLQLQKNLFTCWHKFCDGTWTRNQVADRIKHIRRSVYHHLQRVASSTASKPAGMAKQMLRFEDALWTFVRIDGLEPTNNSAERAIRHAVLMRKSSFGTDSEAGSRYVECMLTVITSLRIQERNVLEFVTASMAAHRASKPGPSLVHRHSTAKERLAA